MHRNDDLTVALNSRPISLLCIVSKVMECCTVICKSIGHIDNFRTLRISGVQFYYNCEMGIAND